MSAEVAQRQVPQHKKKTLYENSLGEHKSTPFYHQNYNGNIIKEKQINKQNRFLIDSILISFGSN